VLSGFDRCKKPPLPWSGRQPAQPGRGKCGIRFAFADIVSSSKRAQHGAYGFYKTMQAIRGWRVARDAESALRSPTRRN
jgi:hypothetical protein